MHLRHRKNTGEKANETMALRLIAVHTGIFSKSNIPEPGTDPSLVYICFRILRRGVPKKGSL